jgi:hypothetical protein
MAPAPRQAAEQATAGIISSSEASLQPVTYRHQFIDPADDAALFG